MEVIQDFSLTNLYMDEVIGLIKSDPERAEQFRQMPKHLFEAPSDSMELVLNKLRDDFGDISGYVVASGGDHSLVQRLRGALLE